MDLRGLAAKVAATQDIIEEMFINNGAKNGLLCVHSFHVVDLWEQNKNPTEKHQFGACLIMPA